MVSKYGGTIGDRTFYSLFLTHKGHGIQLIELKKPFGAGMESWRRMKRLWKNHAPANRGVIFTCKRCKFCFSTKRSYMQQVVKVMDNQFDFRLNMVRHAMEISVSDASRVYGRTHKTVRKWRNQYIKEGLAGLEDRSRRPHNSPNK
ncbi:MAG: hypothetical protein SCARUB_05187, partial [Candidatus Scalindua rubra]